MGDECQGGRGRLQDEEEAAAPGIIPKETQPELENAQRARTDFPG